MGASCVVCRVVLKEIQKVPAFCGGATYPKRSPLRPNLRGRPRGTLGGTTERRRHKPSPACQNGTIKARASHCRQGSSQQSKQNSEIRRIRQRTRGLLPPIKSPGLGHLEMNKRRSPANKSFLFCGRRWVKVRRWVAKRAIALHWQERTQMRLAAPNGVGRRADLAAYEADFGALSA